MADPITNAPAPATAPTNLPPATASAPTPAVDMLTSPLNDLALIAKNLGPNAVERIKNDFIAMGTTATAKNASADLSELLRQGVNSYIKPSYTEETRKDKAKLEAAFGSIPPEIKEAYARLTGLPKDDALKLLHEAYAQSYKGPDINPAIADAKSTIASLEAREPIVKNLDGLAKAGQQKAMDDMIAQMTPEARTRFERVAGSSHTREAEELAVEIARGHNVEINKQKLFTAINRDVNEQAQFPSKQGGGGFQYPAF